MNRILALFLLLASCYVSANEAPPASIRHEYRNIEGVLNGSMSVSEGNYKQLSKILEMETTWVEEARQKQKKTGESQKKLKFTDRLTIVHTKSDKELMFERAQQLAMRMGVELHEKDVEFVLVKSDRKVGPFQSKVEEVLDSRFYMTTIRTTMSMGIWAANIVISSAEATWSLAYTSFFAGTAYLSAILPASIGLSVQFWGKYYAKSLNTVYIPSLLGPYLGTRVTGHDARHRQKQYFRYINKKIDRMSRPNRLDPFRELTAKDRMSIAKGTAALLPESILVKFPMLEIPFIALGTAAGLLTAAATGVDVHVHDSSKLAETILKTAYLASISQGLLDTGASILNRVRPNQMRFDATQFVGSMISITGASMLTLGKLMEISWMNSVGNATLAVLGAAGAYIIVSTVTGKNLSDVKRIAISAANKIKESPEAFLKTIGKAREKINNKSAVQACLRAG